MNPGQRLQCPCTLILTHIEEYCSNSVIITCVLWLRARKLLHHTKNKQTLWLIRTYIFHYSPTKLCITFFFHTLQFHKFWDYTLTCKKRVSYRTSSQSENKSLILCSWVWVKPLWFFFFMIIECLSILGRKNSCHVMWGWWEKTEICS